MTSLSISGRQHNNPPADQARQGVVVSGRHPSQSRRSRSHHLDRYPGAVGRPRAVDLGFIREATHSVGRLVCGTHAAARRRQETLRFGRRNPECQRDLLHWHTVDLVHK
jgi:hypothetical protein